LQIVEIKKIKIADLILKKIIKNLSVYLCIKFYKVNFIRLKTYKIKVSQASDFKSVVKIKKFKIVDLILKKFWVLFNKNLIFSSIRN